MNFHSSSLCLCRLHICHFHRNQLCPSLRRPTSFTSNFKPYSFDNVSVSRKFIQVGMTEQRKVKNSQWLQLDICREYQRNKCPRSEESCTYAHPPLHIETIDGKVVTCYDSLEGRCSRDVCKFYHPPPAVTEKLKQKGRNDMTAQSSLTQSQLSKMTWNSKAINSTSRSQYFNA